MLRSMTTAKLEVTNRVPVVVSPSKAEVEAGRLSERNLELAVRSVLQDGLVVIKDAINHDVLDKLNAKMKEDAVTLRNAGDSSPFNYTKGNLQQDAPPVRAHFEPTIFLSKSMLSWGYTPVDDGQIPLRPRLPLRFWVHGRN